MPVQTRPLPAIPNRAPLAGAAPLYLQLAETLREQIRSGIFLPGERIPTESDLSTSFGLSRITVRQALALLAKEGLIERFPRRGTFVTDRSGPGSWALRSINDLVQLGADTRTQVLSWRLVTPPPAMAALFQSAEPLWRLRALRTHGALPLYFVENFQRREVGDRLTAEDLRQHTMVELLCHKLKIAVSHATEDIRVGQVNALMARHLWLAPGQAVVVQQIDVYGDDGTLIQSGSGWWHSDRLRRRFTFSLTPAESTAGRD